MSMKYLVSHGYRREIFCYPAHVISRLNFGTPKLHSACRHLRKDILIGSEDLQYLIMVNYLRQHQKTKV